MRTSIFAGLMAMAAVVVNAQQGAATLPGAATAPPAATLPGGTPQPPKQDLDITQDYVIGPQDTISVLVYGEPSFTSQNQVVRPDGMISMPLIGEVRASGKHPRDLGADIANILADKFLKYTPKVDIRLEQSRSRYYMIDGAVNKPGQCPLLVPTTLMEALVNAGGFHEFADKKHIRLIRDGKVLVVFNWEDAIKGKHMEKNVPLKHGDLIEVKE